MPQIRLGILVFPNFRRALRRYIVTRGAQYNFLQPIKTLLIHSLAFHVRIYNFSGCLCISWNHWGEGALLTRDQDKISASWSFELRGLFCPVRSPLMCGWRPPFAVRCYVLLSILRSGLDLYCCWSTSDISTTGTICELNGTRLVHCASDCGRFLILQHRSQRKGLLIIFYQLF